MTPEKTFTGPIAAQAQSRGYIDSAQVQTRAGQQLLVVKGWVSEADGSAIQGDIVLQISGKGRRSIFLQTLKVPRPDVNHALNVPDDADRGFSRIVANTFEPGEYDIAVLRDDGGTLRACGIQETIHIP